MPLPCRDVRPRWPSLRRFNRLSIGKAFFGAMPAPRGTPSIVLVTRHGISSQGRNRHPAVLEPRPLRLPISRPTFLDIHVSQVGSSAVSPSPPAVSRSAGRRGGQGKGADARSTAQPPLRGEHGEHGEHWTLMAGATGATL